MSLFVRTFALGAVAALRAGDVAPALRAGDVASSGDNSTDSTADPGCLTDEDLVTALRAAEALGRRIDGLRAHLAAEAAERSRRELGAGGLARRLGCRTHVELVQRVTGAAAATVNRRVRLGQAIRPARRLSGETGPAQFPAVAAAVAAATLGTDAALAVVDALRPTLRVAGAADVAAAEQAIVAEAACPAPGAPPALDADSVRLQGQVWATVLDPDGAEPREADMQRRGLWLLAPRHGLIPVRGNLLPDVAAALRTYADACTSPRTADLPSPGTPAERPSPGVTAEHVPPDERQDRATALPDGGRESLADGHPAHLPETRSKAHQMHDVLASVLGVAARVADAPSLAGNAPTLVIAVRADDVGDTCGTIRAGTPAGAAFAEGCSQPVGLAAARHTGCAGAIQRVVLDPAGRITGIGSPQRCFTGPQRRAIALRDGGCVIPGCHVPVGWCETHHVTTHAADPTGTHTDNGVLLCWYHHRTIDTSGWRIRMVAGMPEVQAPHWLDREGTWRPARGSPVRMLELVRSPGCSIP